MSEPALTAFDLEAIMRDLWNEVGDAGNKLIISKRTFLMLKRANRMWERRKRARSLIHRGSLVKLREIDLPEITYQEPPREPVSGLRSVLAWVETLEPMEVKPLEPFSWDAVLKGE